MLDKKIVDKLNTQINLEFYSSNLYLQMSAWCEKNALSNCASFLREHAAEEMQHMQKLFDYLLETGGLPIIGNIDAPPIEFENISDIFQKTLNHEKDVTKSINDLVDVALSLKDYSTFNFLQWYVSEQHEEEALFSSILDRISLLGEESKNLFFLDKAVADLVRVHETKNA